MKRISALLAACIVCVGVGCNKAQPRVATPVKPAAPGPALKAAPQTPIAEKKDELGGATWDPGWDAVVEKALPASMLSGKAAHAVAGFCPNFAREKEADKRAFWAYLFQALAGAEAGLDPTTTVHHTDAVLQRVDRVTHRAVRQEGLLQLTYDDQIRYGCDFDWNHDKRLARKDPDRTILTPERNLTCGVHILQNQIIRQGKPLVSRTSYFATLQPGTLSYRVFRKQMANVPAACGVGALKPRRRHARTNPRVAATALP